MINVRRIATMACAATALSVASLVAPHARPFIDRELLRMTTVHRRQEGIGMELRGLLADLGFNLPLADRPAHPSLAASLSPRAALKAWLAGRRDRGRVVDDDEPAVRGKEPFSDG